MLGLHHRFSELSNVEDHKFAEPFLSTNKYLRKIEKMMDEDEKNNIHHSKEQRRIYLNKWVSPKPHKQQIIDALDISQQRSIHRYPVSIILLLFLFAFCGILVYMYCYDKTQKLIDTETIEKYSTFNTDI